MHAPVHRCLAVWVVATLAATALLGWLVPIALAPSPRFDDALVRVCALAAGLSAAWLWLLTAAVVVEAATGARVRGVPASVRRVVLAACGVAIVTGLAVPAQATPGEQHRDRSPAATSQQSLSGLPLPDRATDRATDRAAARAEAPQPHAAVVVRPGDTLWDLAGTDLGPGATAAEIDARWREIYAANRDLIGPDPDLIQPAQRLRLPQQ